MHDSCLAVSRAFPVWFSLRASSSAKKNSALVSFASTLHRFECCGLGGDTCVRYLVVQCVASFLTRVPSLLFAGHVPGAMGRPPLPNPPYGDPLALPIFFVTNDELFIALNDISEIWYHLPCNSVIFVDIPMGPSPGICTNLDKFGRAICEFW